MQTSAGKFITALVRTTAQKDSPRPEKQGQVVANVHDTRKKSGNLLKEVFRCGAQSEKRGKCRFFRSVLSTEMTRDETEYHKTV